MTSHDALYSRSTGRRLSPGQGRAPDSGAVMAVLVFDDGHSVPLAGDAVVGRDPGRDSDVASGRMHGIVVQDPSGCVSRCHLRLRVRSWRIEAIDLGSRNGTMITDPDGTWRRIMPGLGHTMQSGQSLKIGTTTATIHHLSRAGLD